MSPVVRQAAQCPQCGEMAVLREQHTPDGMLPSQKYHKYDPTYKPRLLCEKCIDANLLDQARQKQRDARMRAFATLRRSG